MEKEMIKDGEKCGEQFCSPHFSGEVMKYKGHYFLLKYCHIHHRYIYKKWEKTPPKGFLTLSEGESKEFEIYSIQGNLEFFAEEI